jgi:signal transduction histidine kinase
MSDTSERPRRRLDITRVTVQAWFFAVLAVMSVLVAGGTFVGAQLLQHNTDASNRLIQHIQPARAEAYRLQAALIDQETATRGYALTGDRQFLTPYPEGQQTEAQSVALIRRLLPHDTRVLADLQEIEDAAEAWRRDYADPLVAGVTPGDPRPLDRRAATEAKRAFDDIRALFNAQNDDLVDVRESSLADLRQARTQRNWVFSAMVGVFFVTAVGMTLLVWLLVIRPLRRLGSSSRRIADGEFDHPIEQNGPDDIRDLARDVDSMRRRIMAELDTSRAQEREVSALAASLDEQAVELRRSNAELEQFAYVASHDLQEPLRKVASFCQLLEKRYADELDERGRQYIDFAVDGAKRMQVLITDLLTFSRVGRVNDSHEPVALDVGLDKAVANLAVAIEESDAVVQRPEQLPVVEGDATLLAMLWQNLVGNAIKFRSPDRAPVVSVTCEADPASETDWLLTVTDNGIGIPPEFAEKVFVIFQRLHSRETYSGTGIGLALCKKIVDYHGGRIWIDTEHAGGTRICFTLPAQPAPGRADQAVVTIQEGTPA